MLTKRASILFEEDFWKTLVQLSRQENASVGKLIRDAVAEKYSKEAELVGRRKAFESVLKHRPKPYSGKINYKELINAGRTIY